MKNNRLHIALLVALFALVYGLTFDPKLDIAGDSAAYIELARNIAAGYGYSNIGVDGITPANFYPVGYPVILSVMIAVGLDNLFAFKILNGIFMFAAIVLVFFAAKGLTGSRPLSFTVAALTLLSPRLLQFAAMPMSEMSFMFFSMLSLFALWRTSEGERRFGLWFWIAVAAAAISYHIRTVGVATMLAVAVFHLFRREWARAAVGTASMAALLVPWIVRNRLLGLSSRFFGTIMTVNPWRPEQGEIATVGEFLKKMWTNLDDTVLKGFREVLFPFWQGNYAAPSSIWGVVLGFVVLAVVVYGLWKLRPLRWALVGYMGANIALLMLWHGGNDLRYVTPMIPVVCLGFWSGVYHIINRITRKEQRALPYAALVLAVFTIQPLQRLAEQSKAPYPPAYRNYFAMAKEMNRKLPPRTVVCCRKPELFHYYAPRLYCTSYRYTTDDAELVGNLVDRRVDFVVLEQLGYASTGRYLYPAIQKSPDLFRGVWKLENPDTYLIRFDREEATLRNESR